MLKVVANAYMDAFNNSTINMEALAKYGNLNNPASRPLLLSSNTLPTAAIVLLVGIPLMCGLGIMLYLLGRVSKKPLLSTVPPLKSSDAALDNFKSPRASPKPGSVGAGSGGSGEVSASERSSTCAVSSAASVDFCPGLTCTVLEGASFQLVCPATLTRPVTQERQVGEFHVTDCTSKELMKGLISENKPSHHGILLQTGFDVPIAFINTLNAFPPEDGQKGTAVRYTGISPISQAATFYPGFASPMAVVTRLEDLANPTVVMRRCHGNGTIDEVMMRCSFASGHYSVTDTDDGIIGTLQDAEMPGEPGKMSQLLHVEREANIALVLCIIISAIKLCWD